jgi:predicted nucleotidyltransferase
MKLATLIDKLKNINGVVAISQFGSYGSELWIENRSDIDLAVVVGSEVSYRNTLSMEDEILPIFEAYYDYPNIHITFILFKEFTSKYARMAVDSECVFIVDENRWFDFQHYVFKYARNNSQFERMLKIDEQYTYFGGIIDESIL